ncbi:MAG TPA: response regulator transcription factor [Candidatus Ventricola intestinavium]|nr:response regulator transcription factor [Candidatus Ventricola intestinavium]
MARILVVEDDTSQRTTMCAYIAAAGHEAWPAADTRAAQVVMSSRDVQLMVCDVMLPGEDGFAFSRRVRKEHPRLPILIVTARGEMTDKREGFLSGADDYMTKPVELDEMMLRIGALLRRAQIMAGQIIRVGQTCVDARTRTVSVGERKLDLARREFDLLFHLLSYPGQVMTRRQLIEAVWGANCESDERTVDVHIGRLREHLADVSDFEIETVRGLGYRVQVKQHAK